MHITFYKPGRVPIPPRWYGGTQRVIYWLGKGLQELGHTITLIANARSRIPGAELRPIPSGSSDPNAWLRLVPDKTDLIHMWDTSEPTAHKPFLVTQDGIRSGHRRFHPNTVFVSRKHAAYYGSDCYVYNGLDPAEYTCLEQRGDYAVFLAKASAKMKNLKGAVQVARLAGVELRVLGSRSWPLGLHRLRPAFRGVRYYGMVGGAEKRELLARARCLIFPVRWEEPFGLAITEMLVSGGYVAATPYGSLPEIVTEKTGVLSAQAEELAEAVRNPRRFVPADCRARVLEGGFTYLDMARNYVRYYERVLTRGLLREGPGPIISPDYPKHLLPWDD